MRLRSSAAIPGPWSETRISILSEVRRTLSPEFINRLDEIIVFDALGEEQLREIARIMIQRLNAGLEQRNIVLEASDDVCTWLVRETASDRSYGARCGGPSSGTSRTRCPRR